MKYYFQALKNYAIADGRATRREVIWYFVFHYLFMFIIAFLDGFFGFYSNEIPLDYGYMTIIYMLATACPTICLQVRRLHDIGKSGSWWWGTKIPFLNLYVFYLLYLKRGDENTNEYGAPVRHIRTKEPTQSTTHASPSAQAQETVSQPNPVNTAASQPVRQNPVNDKSCFLEQRKVVASPTPLNTLQKQVKVIREKRHNVSIIILSIVCALLVVADIAQYFQNKEASRNAERQLIAANDTISSQRLKIHDLETDSNHYNDIIRLAKGETFGYAASNFRASTGVIVVDKYRNNYKFTLTANWSKGGTVEVDYSSSAARVEFGRNEWTTSTTMTVIPNHEGVCVVTFSNNVDSKRFSILIIVTD